MRTIVITNVSPYNGMKVDVMRPLHTERVLPVLCCEHVPEVGNVDFRHAKFAEVECDNYDHERATNCKVIRGLSPAEAITEFYKLSPTQMMELSRSANYTPKPLVLADPNRLCKRKFGGHAVYDLRRGDIISVPSGSYVDAPNCDNAIVLAGDKCTIRLTGRDSMVVCGDRCRVLFSSNGGRLICGNDCTVIYDADTGMAVGSYGKAASIVVGRRGKITTTAPTYGVDYRKQIQISDETELSVLPRDAYNKVWNLFATDNMPWLRTFSGGICVGIISHPASNYNGVTTGFGGAVVTPVNDCPCSGCNKNMSGFYNRNGEDVCQFCKS